MKRKGFTFTFIILLTTILAVELVYLYQDLTAPKSISLDDKIEKPELIELNKPNSKQDFKYTSSKYNTKSIKPKTTKQSITKPLPEVKFLKVMKLSQDEFQFSKEDYLSKTKKTKSNDSVNPSSSSSTQLISNWEKKILEPESVVEKSLTQASKHIQEYESKLNTQSHFNTSKEMERFAIKIELPDMNDGAKFKLQYREPPDFGRSNIPEAALAAPRNPEPTAAFSIEKTKAYDSPWDNFSGPRNP